MSAVETRPAWEAGPPDDARFAPTDAYSPAQERLPAALPGSVPDAQLPDAISRALVPMQMRAPEALPAKPSANVAKRVAAVMSEIQRIEKRGHNKHFNFDFATIDDIRAAMATLCGKHGLAWRQTELLIFPLGKLLGVTYQFTLLAEDEPEHEAFPTNVTVLTAIQTKAGLDEKAFSKARALAWKDWAKSQFSIPTGEDPEEADPDASGGAPTDRDVRQPRQNGGRPVSGYSYKAADGQRHQSDTAEEWIEAWRKRIRAFVMAKRLEDLRAAARANAEEIRASGEAGATIQAEIDAALEGPQAAPDTGASQPAGGDAKAGATPEVRPEDVPPVRKANGPEKWVENFIAAVAKCDTMAVLDALIVREKQSIETIRANHGTLNASLTRAVLDRRAALEASGKAQA